MIGAPLFKSTTAGFSTLECLDVEIPSPSKPNLFHSSPVSVDTPSVDITAALAKCKTHSQQIASFISFIQINIRAASTENGLCLHEHTDNENVGRWDAMKSICEQVNLSLKP